MEQDEKIKLGDCSPPPPPKNKNLTLGIHWNEPFKLKGERRLLKARRSSPNCLVHLCFPGGEGQGQAQGMDAYTTVQLGNGQVLVSLVNLEWTHRSFGNKWPKRLLTGLTWKSVFSKTCSFSSLQLRVLITFLMLRGIWFKTLLRSFHLFYLLSARGYWGDWEMLAKYLLLRHCSAFTLLYLCTQFTESMFTAVTSEAETCKGNQRSSGVTHLGKFWLHLLAVWSSATSQCPFC